MKADTRVLCTVPLMTAITVICSWITIPFAIPFTLQTLAIYLSMLLLGKSAFISILLYIALGAVGLPVFSSFGGGIGVLLGPTGGFIFGFLAVSLVYSAVVYLLRKRRFHGIIGCILGTAVLYLCGTLWYCFVYGGISGYGVLDALKLCVLPFIIPDAVKLVLAALIARRLRGFSVY